MIPALFVLLVALAALGVWVPLWHERRQALREEAEALERLARAYEDEAGEPPPGWG